MPKTIKPPKLTKIARWQRCIQGTKLGLQVEKFATKKGSKDKIHKQFYSVKAELVTASKEGEGEQLAWD